MCASLLGRSPRARARARRRRAPGGTRPRFTARRARLAARARRARDTASASACAAIGGSGPSSPSRSRRTPRPARGGNCGAALSLAHALRARWSSAAAAASSSSPRWRGSRARARRELRGHEGLRPCLAEGLWFELRPRGVDVLALVPRQHRHPRAPELNHTRGKRPGCAPRTSPPRRSTLLGREPFTSAVTRTVAFVAALDRDAARRAPPGHGREHPFTLRG